MNPSRSQKCSLEDLYAKVKEILTGNQFRVLVMNGKNDVESSDYEAGCNFVVGGNTLGRGVTFPGLQTIYYTRTSKNRRQIQCGSIAGCLDMIVIRA